MSVGDLVRLRGQTIATLNVSDLRAGDLGAHAREHGGNVLQNAPGNVIAELFALIVGVGADDRNGPHAFAQRQQVSLVSEENNALPRGLQSECLVRLRVRQAGRLLGIDIRVFE